MKGQKKKQNGITLIALVISIIVMLILAGVSLNATIGENGILMQAQNGRMITKIAGYKEELEMNIVSLMGKDGFNSRETVTVLNDNVRRYIPSLEDNDIGKYGIIRGELYYLGEVGNNEYNMAIAQELKVNSNGKSADEFLLEVESIAIESIVKNMAGNTFVTTDEEGNSTEVGVKLYDKTFANGNKWKIITDIRNGLTYAIYGTGWTYVEAGKSVDGLGILKQSYIINFEDRIAVKFDATKHTMLAFGGNLAVKDNSLILNADPTNMGDANSWGEAQIYGFSETEEDEEGNVISGWTPSALYFDGVDDYVRFDTLANFNSGITIEIYGKTMPSGTGTVIGAFSHREKNNCSGNQNGLWMAFSANTCNGMFTSAYSTGMKKYQDNFAGDHFDFKLRNEPDDEGFVTLTVNDSGVANVYFNGEFFDTDTFSTSYFNDALQKLNDASLHWEFSRGYWSGTWHYINSVIYSIRVYNRALTSYEVKANYNATVSYHNILVNGGTAETGGNTEGNSY